MPPQRRKKKPKRDDAPLRKPPAPPSAIDPTTLTERLRQIHEEAEDPRVENMPPADELWGVVKYCERHASALRSYAQLDREQAILCIQLCEYMREQGEPIEGRFAQRALDAGSTLDQIAGPMRVGGPSGAYRKIRRFRAVELSARPDVGPVRRTPEAVSRVERELAEAERRRRLKKFVAEDRASQWADQARALLSVRQGLPKDETGIVSFWLDQLEYDLDEESSAGAVAHGVQSLIRYVDISVKRYEGSGVSGEAERVLSDVREFISEDSRDTGS